MAFIIGIMIGFSIGLVFGRWRLHKEAIGLLRIDQSDPDSGPYLFLEVSRQGMSAIYKKKYVVLKTEVKNYISQE